MKEITNDHQIPAFVWLARPDSWNWDKLPENVYAMPNAPIEEVLTHNNYDKMVEATDAYIEELYSINSGSKFNLYINDYNSYLYLKLLAGNGIPESNYYVTLLSDGGASYADFNKAISKRKALTQTLNMPKWQKSSTPFTPRYAKPRITTAKAASRSTAKPSDSIPSLRLRK